MIRRKAGADVSHIPLINSTNRSFCRLLSTAARTSPTSKLNGLGTSNAAERSSVPFAYTAGEPEAPRETRLLQPLPFHRLPGARRDRLVALTEAGWAKLAQSQPLWEEAQRRFERAFGEEKARAFRATFD